MIRYRKLSIALTDLLAEAQALVDLKAKFGRLPNSALKDAVLEEIEAWFNARGEDPQELLKPKLMPPEVSTSAGLISAGSGVPQFTDESVMADDVPDDDEIPF